MTYRRVLVVRSTGGVAGLDFAASLSLALLVAVPLAAKGVPGLTPTEDVVGTLDDDGWGVRGLF